MIKTFHLRGKLSLRRGMLLEGGETTGCCKEVVLKTFLTLRPFNTVLHVVVDPQP